MNTSSRMSNVQFRGKTPQEYIQVPIELIVNLATTTVILTLSTGDGRTIQARPAMTLTEVNDLRRQQRFDVTAFVAGVGEARSVNATCEVRDIMLIDQSADQGTKVQQAKLSSFYDKTATKSGAMIDISRTAEGSADPISFFGLNAKWCMVVDYFQDSALRLRPTSSS